MSVLQTKKFRGRPPQTKETQRQMEGLLTRFQTSWVIGIFIVGLIIWDYFMFKTNERGDTISEVTLRSSIKTPLIPYLTGVLCGHLLWPRVIYGSSGDLVNSIYTDFNGLAFVVISSIVVLAIHHNLKNRKIYTKIWNKASLPIVFFLAGVVVGHFFWYQEIR